MKHTHTLIQTSSIAVAFAFGFASTPAEAYSNIAFFRSETRVAQEARWQATTPRWQSGAKVPSTLARASCTGGSHARRPGKRADVYPRWQSVNSKVARRAVVKSFWFRSMRRTLQAFR